MFKSSVCVFLRQGEGREDDHQKEGKFSFVFAFPVISALIVSDLLLVSFIPPFSWSIPVSGGSSFPRLDVPEPWWDSSTHKRLIPYSHFAFPFKLRMLSYLNNLDFPCWAGCAVQWKGQLTLVIAWWSPDLVWSLCLPHCSSADPCTTPALLWAISFALGQVWCTEPLLGSPGWEKSWYLLFIWGWGASWEFLKALIPFLGFKFEFLFQVLLFASVGVTEVDDPIR